MTREREAGRQEKSIRKKEVAKAYERYTEQFTPRPRYLMNS